MGKVTADVAEKYFCLENFYRTPPLLLKEQAQQVARGGQRSEILLCFGLRILEKIIFFPATRRRECTRHSNIPSNASVCPLDVLLTFAFFPRRIPRIVFSAISRLFIPTSWNTILIFIIIIVRCTLIISFFFRRLQSWASLGLFLIRYREFRKIFLLVERDDTRG